jgi:ubiquitin-conjugating enzyme E2 W
MKLILLFVSLLLLCCLKFSASSFHQKRKNIFCRGGKSKDKADKVNTSKLLEKSFFTKIFGKPKPGEKGIILTVTEKIKAFVHNLLPGLFGGKKKRNRDSGNDDVAEKKKQKKKGKLTSGQEHLGKLLDSGDGNSRIQNELRSFINNPPENCKVHVGSNIRQWVVSITGPKGTIYEGEKYKLKMIFPKEYPSKPPSVYFLKPTPKHVHVYSNGDICLNLLGKDWRSTMTAELLAVSILSMLASAKEKKSPVDNAMHADMAPGQQQDNWMYHDDNC